MRSVLGEVPGSVTSMLRRLNTCTSGVRAVTDRNRDVRIARAARTGGRAAVTTAAFAAAASNPGTERRKSDGPSSERSASMFPTRSTSSSLAKR